MNDYHIFPAAAVAFSITIALMIALRPLATSIGLVDRPGGRKLHIGEVPVIGGVAMFIGIVSGLAVVGVESGLTINLVFAFFLLVLVGALDDRFAVPAMARILVQISAVLIASYGSEQMLSSIGNPFGFGEIHLGPFELFATLIVAITVINAYNLVDGVDGLSGILAAIALVAVSVVGGLDAMSTIVALVVVASVAGFLIFNFPIVLNRRIRSFMGDAGSTLLGFAIFWVTLGVSQGESAIISPVVGLWFASIPIYDSLTCFVRRVAAGRSPFSAGRDHFHHTLERGGFSVQQKLAILGGLQVIYSLIAIGGHLAGIADVFLFIAWSVLGLSQRWVIKTVSRQHLEYMLRKLRAGELEPFRAERVRALL